MQDVIDKIRLDLNKQKVRTSVSVCVGDTISRTLCITLLNNGAVYEVPEGAIATFWATKPDGRKVYNDCVIQGNEVCYTIKNQLIAAAGDVECQIKVTASDGTVIHSPTFIIRVYEKLFDESILESTNDYSALQSYCMRAEQAASNIQATANSLKEAIKSVSDECNEAKKIADAAVMVRECSGSVIEVKSPYSVIMITNVKGCTYYQDIQTPDAPIYPASLAANGTIDILISSNRSMENIWDTFTLSGVNELRKVGKYVDELCYQNSEMYVKRRTSKLTLTSNIEIEELDLYKGTAYEGILHAFATPIIDSIKNPDGIWYTCSHFFAEITLSNNLPAINRALQNTPGYFVFTTDMNIQEFTEFLSNSTVEIIYVSDSAVIEGMSPATGIYKYIQSDLFYVSADTSALNDEMVEISVQIPNNAFADAVMQLL